MTDRKKFFLIAGFFAVFYFLPDGSERIHAGLIEAVRMMSDYAREHVLLCLVPAFFIAGAVSVFVSQDSVLRYLGGKANKIISYSVASISGTVLAVCSCTVLPLFAGIYMRGAGLGTATTFLYSGPAINILAITMTARVLGFEMGVARAVGAVGFSIIIGLLMSYIFKNDDAERQKSFAEMPQPEASRPLWKTVIHMVGLIGFLIFATKKWVISGVFLAITLISTFSWFDKDERSDWMSSTWGYLLQVTPLLFGGVLVAGFLLGRPGHEALIPGEYVSNLVGGNGIFANFFASFAGALMYFSTLTEVPILQGLLGAGMGKGPALALLLSGPALSLPSILVIQSVLGWKKTLTYIALIVVLSTVAGMIYGAIWS